MGKRQPFQQMVLGKPNIYMREENLDPYFLTPCTKINSNRIKERNLRTKTIKHLGEYIGKKFHIIVFGNDFLDTNPKAQLKNNKLDIKI